MSDTSTMPDSEWTDERIAEELRACDTCPGPTRPIIRSLLLELQRVRKEMSELVVYDVEDIGKARADALEEAENVIRAARALCDCEVLSQDLWDDLREALAELKGTS